MFRKKGWAHLYDKYSREEVRAELRRIERADYIHDREAKVKYLDGLHPIALTPKQQREARPYYAFA